jgi:drug/metabolite transporter (DMT)-like permease
MTPRQFAALLLLAALWGASFLFIRITVPDLGAIVVSEGRVLIAAVALLAYAAWMRALPTVRGRVRAYLVLGAVSAAAPFALIAAAETRLEASLAAVLNALTPLFGALAAALWLGQALTARAALGLALGVAGVALVVGLAPVELDLGFALAVAASVLAALCYALGATFTRLRLAGVRPLELAVAQQVAATLLLAPLVPLVPPAAAPSGGVLAALGVLGVACTGFAFVLYFRLLEAVGPTSALTVTFLVPAFGVLWGWLFLDEAVGLGTLLGGVLVLAGVRLVTAPSTLHVATESEGKREPPQPHRDLGGPRAGARPRAGDAGPRLPARDARG